jgi:ribosome-binding factor A
MDHRTERITEALREELAELVGYEMSDPRVTGVVVTDVVISPDKKVAQVRIGLHGGGDSKAALKALEGAKHFLRRELASRLELYRVPDLRFETDVAGELGARMEHLLKRIRKGRPREGTEATSEEKPQKEAVE